MCHKKDTVQNGQEHSMKELHQMVNNVPTRGKPQCPWTAFLNILFSISLFFLPLRDDPAKHFWRCQCGHEKYIKWNLATNNFFFFFTFYSHFNILQYNSWPPCQYKAYSLWAKLLLRKQHAIWVVIVVIVMAQTLHHLRNHLTTDLIQMMRAVNCSIHSPFWFN